MLDALGDDNERKEGQDLVESYPLSVYDGARPRKAGGFGHKYSSVSMKQAPDAPLHSAKKPTIKAGIDTNLTKSRKTFL